MKKIAIIYTALFILYFVFFMMSCTKIEDHTGVYYLESEPDRYIRLTRDGKVSTNMIRNPAAPGEEAWGHYSKEGDIVTIVVFPATVKGRIFLKEKKLVLTPTGWGGSLLEGTWVKK